MEGENWFEAAYQDMRRRNMIQAKQSKTCAPYEKKACKQDTFVYKSVSKTTKENVNMHGHSKVIWKKKEAFAGLWIEMVFFSDMVFEYLV